MFEHNPNPPSIQAGTNQTETSPNSVQPRFIYQTHTVQNSSKPSHHFPNQKPHTTSPAFPKYTQNTLTNKANNLNTPRLPLPVLQTNSPASVRLRSGASPRVSKAEFTGNAEYQGGSTTDTAAGWEYQLSSGRKEASVPLPHPVCLFSLSLHLLISASPLSSSVSVLSFSDDALSALFEEL